MNKNRNIQIARLGLLLLIALVFGSSINDDVNSSKKAYTFGIDISHYQEKVDWDKLVTSDHPIRFVFIRSTMGSDSRDSQFERNWKNAREKEYIRGAYHYYRPYENSTKQFRNYSKHVKLKKGDFVPILDIEKPSPYGAANLRKGVLNWLKLAEEHYKVKPVIYTGKKFYNDYLKGHVDDYPLWIASYSKRSSLRGIDWTIHQFSDRVKVTGIKGNVDGNNFKGDLSDLEEMCIK